MSETRFELNPTDASEIAGLNVIRSYSNQAASAALDRYAGKIWAVAKAAFGLTDAPIRINVSEDSRTLDYFAEDGSERGKIILEPSGYAISVVKES